MVLLRPVPTADTPHRPVTPIRPMPCHPDAAELRQLLEGLFDRAVAVTPLQDPPPSPDPERDFTAIYAVSDGEVVVVVSCDLPLAAAFGSALALIPATQAEQWIESGTLTEDGHANAAEVLNISASVFNDLNPSRHVKIVDVARPGAPRPAEVEGVLARARRSDAYRITVEGYPAGVVRLSSI